MVQSDLKSTQYAKQLRSLIGNDDVVQKLLTALIFSIDDVFTEQRNEKMSDFLDLLMQVEPTIAIKPTQFNRHIYYQVVYMLKITSEKVTHNLLQLLIRYISIKRELKRAGNSSKVSQELINKSTYVYYEICLQVLVLGLKDDE